MDYNEGTILVGVGGWHKVIWEISALLLAKFCCEPTSQKIKATKNKKGKMHAKRFGGSALRNDIFKKVRGRH